MGVDTGLENFGPGNKLRTKAIVIPFQNDTLELDDEQTTSDRDISEASEASRRLFREDIASLAVAELTSPERQLHYPATVQEVIARRKQAAARADPSKREFTDAYAELGGGLAPNRQEEPGLALQNVLNDDYEPWQSDIKLAVEQFGVADFSADELRQMKPSDYRLFCLHFYAYLQNIDANIRLIEGVEGDGDIDARLRERYGKQSPEALKKYCSTLDWLKQDLEETGIPHSVRTTLDVPERAIGTKRRRDLLEEARLDKRRYHHDRGIRVIVKKDKKPGIERATN